MERLSVQLDDSSIGILEGYAAAKALPPEGVITLALMDLAGKDFLKDRTLPACDYLSELADQFEASPPATPDEVTAFVEKLRYVAQFTTTQDIPRYDVAPPAVPADGESA